MTRADGPRVERALLILGALYVLFALLVNERTIAAWLGIDHLGPVAVWAIRALDLAAIAWGALTIAFRRRPLVADANLSITATILLVLSIEGVLHAFPRLLGDTFANGILSKYSTNPDGIYYFDPVLGMNFMLPSDSTEMTYNGYRWRHETDQYGFRNAQGITSADILLLGDSFIYGHGLEAEHTVGAALQRLTGRTVYNLGRQGDSSLQEAYLLTSQISRLQPRVVLYFFCQNDIRDLYAYRTDHELEAFIDAPVDDISYPAQMDVPAALQLRSMQNDSLARQRSLRAVVSRLSYLVRLYYLRQFIREQRAFTTTISDPQHDENRDSSLGWRYTHHAIAYMNRVAARHHATLVVAPIPSINPRLISILKEVAAQEAVPFVDTGSMDPADPSNAALFLPGDGHLSERGARTLAGLVQEYLVKNPSLFSRGPS